MAGRRPSPNPYQSRIQELETELFALRFALIEMMPHKARAILHGHGRLTNMREWYAWAKAAAEQIVDLCTDVESPTYMGVPLGSPRARCPLCGAGPQTPYESGFALPEGLNRHLTGGHNAHQCPVFGAAERLARDYVERQESRAQPG